MTPKKLQQDLRDAVSYYNTEALVDRALLVTQEFGNLTIPYNYHAFTHVGKKAFDTVHEHVHVPLKELFNYNLWPTIRHPIYSFLNACEKL